MVSFPLSVFGGWLPGHEAGVLRAVILDTHIIPAPSAERGVAGLAGGNLEVAEEGGVLTAHHTSGERRFGRPRAGYHTAAVFEADYLAWHSLPPCGYDTARAFGMSSLPAFDGVPARSLDTERTV